MADRQVPGHRMLCLNTVTNEVGWHDAEMTRGVSKGLAAAWGRPQSSARYTGRDVDGTKIAGSVGENTAASE